MQLSNLTAGLGNMINFGGNDTSSVSNNINASIAPISISEEPVGVRNERPRQINTTTPAETENERNSAGSESINDQIKQITEIKRRNLAIMQHLEDIMKRYSRRSDPLRA